MRFIIPIKLPSLANMRLHWRAMASLKAKQKETTSLAMKHAMQNQILPVLPMIVTITRIGPHKLDDDNLASACKYVRDAIAKIVGMDDGSPLYTWVYRQDVGTPYIIVEITPR